MRTLAEIEADGTPRSPFANGTEYDIWAARWCEHCVNDRAFQMGTSNQGCPLLLIALTSMTPSEWAPGPRDEQGRFDRSTQWICGEFKRAEP